MNVRPMNTLTCFVITVYPTSSHHRHGHRYNPSIHSIILWTPLTPTVLQETWKWWPVASKHRAFVCGNWPQVQLTSDLWACRLDKGPLRRAGHVSTTERDRDREVYKCAKGHDFRDGTGHTHTFDSAVQCSHSNQSWASAAAHLFRKKLWFIGLTHWECDSLQMELQHISINCLLCAILLK